MSIMKLNKEQISQRIVELQLELEKTESSQYVLMGQIANEVSEWYEILEGDRLQDCEIRPLLSELLGKPVHVRITGHDCAFGIGGILEKEEDCDWNVFTDNESFLSFTTSSVKFIDKNFIYIDRI